MTTTFETAHGTKATAVKRSMEFTDDMDKECSAVVIWEYAMVGSESIVTEISINPVYWARITDADLIDLAYDFIRDNHNYYVTFETKGQVTVIK